MIILGNILIQRHGRLNIQRLGHIVRMYEDVPAIRDFNEETNGRRQNGQPRLS